ncbi:hypothetical protein ESCOCK368M_20835 [Escherichia coli]
MKLWPVLTGIALSFTLIACKAPTPPKGVQPITNFDANRYLGKWGNDSNLLIVFYVQIMPDDFVMQLHRF